MADEKYADQSSDADVKAAEEAHAASADNHSVPSPESRDLWQSANIGTDGTGPRVEDVAPVFAQARADALANPVTADSDDEALANENAQSAESAQEEADALRTSVGYAAPTGADAGQFDDPALEENVPAENFSAAPSDEEVAEGADTNKDGVVDESEAKAANSRSTSRKNSAAKGETTKSETTSKTKSETTSK